MTTWPHGDARGSAHALGALDRDADLAIFKTWVNTPTGASALMTVFSAGDGATLGVAEAGAAGALRTAAISGVATRVMADPDADELAVLGAGRQALRQVEAVAAVRPLRRVRLWNRTTERAHALADQVRGELGLDAVVAGSVGEATRDVPVVTPFTADGALDLASLRGLVRRQIESGSHGVSVGGSTGEPSAQTVAERIEAIRAVAAEVDDAVPFLPGTGSAKLDETLEITAAARDAGADAALLITPYYARPTQEALYTWYRTVAAEFPDLPIVIYNVPSRTAVDVAPETVARLFADCDNVVGIKETTKDFEHFSRVLHLCGRELMVWSGIELLGLPLLALGGAGFVSAVSNLAPAAVARMYEAWEAGDHETARELHYGLHPLVDLLFVETNPAPAKWVLHQQGHLASAHVRAPLLPLGDDGLPRVRALLDQGAALLGPS
nr:MULTISPECIES: 4-hydroxy-tetrahydrodipicolinate synthase [unclassified Pseudonocardia]